MARDWIGAHPVALTAVASVAVHLLFLSRRLGEDEGGFAMVGRFWDQPGRYLYGPQWVDRPPVLIWVFAVADHLGPYGVRLTAAAVGTVTVAAAGWAAAAVGGRRAATWAALTALAFSASTLLQGERLNGEPVAAMFVMVSMALLLHACSAAPPRRVAWLAAAAGATATAAVLTKQDFVDGLVFGLVLWGMRARRRPARQPIALGAAPIAGGYLAGVLATGGGVLAWAWSGGKLAALLYAMYGFRFDAAAVMARWSFAQPLHRLQVMVGLALASGLAVLVGLLATSQLHRPTQRRPVAYAVAAAFGVELVGIAAGGNYWSHYLLGLVPTVALASGLVAAGPLASCRRRRAPAWWTRAVVVSSLVVTVAQLPWAWPAAHGPSSSEAVGRWIGASAAPGDTVTVVYTHADLVGASGLAPAYPYAWSLPIRTLDPRLDLLVSTLNGRQAPTWFVRWGSPHPWSLDPHDRITTALQTHYVEVAEVGGSTVWLHDGQSRQLAPRDLLPNPGSRA